MDATGKTILVAGATGRQGGATVRHLKERGFRVRAMTRDTRSAKAQALANQGVEVVEGDMADRASLDQALAGVYGAFSVQNFNQSGLEGEVLQGITLADAAKAAGVQHLVYSSVGSAHRGTGIPHFESKFRVEEHIRAIGVPHTVLRPVFLMENWYAMRDLILNGTLALQLDPTRSLQQLAVDDIGAFAALAFADPDQWLGRELELAGDELTMEQTAALFSRVIGRPVQYVQAPMEQARQRMGEDGVLMFNWLSRVGFEADIPALRALYPGLTSLETWIRTAGWIDAAPQQ